MMLPGLVAASRRRSSAFVPIGTVTLSALAGSAGGEGAGSPTIDTVTMTAPGGSADAQAVASAALDTVTMTAAAGSAGADGDAAASVATVTVTAPAASADGGVTFGIIQFQSVSGSHALTLGAAPANGNTLIALITDSSSTQTANTGWSIVQQAGTFAGQSYSIAKKLCGAGESATQQPTTSGGGGETIFMWEIAGANATTPVVSGKVHTSTATFTNTTGWGLTPTASGQIGLVAVVTSSSSTMTPGSLGVTWTQDVNTGSAWGGHKLNPTSGTELNYDLGWSGTKNETTIGAVISA